MTNKHKLKAVLVLLTAIVMLFSSVFVFVACDNDEDSDGDFGCNHVYGDPVVTMATAFEKGTETQKCTLCGNTVTRYIDSNTFSELQGQSDRVILFIGDGMGENHIKVTEAYYQKELFFDDWKLEGYVNTACASQFQTTDSAAAASAMATGYKYSRGEIAQKKGVDMQSVTEIAKSLGKGVGIVTTATISDATPAGFSAHASKRSDKATIMTSQLTSGVDIFLGAGLYKDENDDDDIGYSEYRTQFEEAGYTFSTLYSELNLESDKIIGSFAQVVNDDFTDETPTLDKLAEFAIDYLEAKYPNGYFLMIEGAHIDKMSSNKDITSMMAYLDEFDDAIEAVSNKLKDVDNYAMIVTADHECGDLQYNGETGSDINDSLFHATYHTKVDVRIYSSWKLKTLDDYDLPDRIDNTDIFTLCKQLLG